jgi:hypothetical protein
MLIAVDTISDTIVTGPPDTPPEATVGQYECLFCETSLELTAPAPNDPLDTFTHQNGTDCLHNDNASTAHRIGEELIGRELCQWLHQWFAVSPQEITIAAEKHVGTDTTWMIADVRVSHPVQLAVEVVYLSSALNLRERLQLMFDQEYSGMVAVVADGQVSPTRIERHLSAVGAIQVGEVDPNRLEASIGSVVTPDRVDLSPDAWQTVPEFLA